MHREQVRFIVERETAGELTQLYKDESVGGSVKPIENTLSLYDRLERVGELDAIPIYALAHSG